jgi:uncharacterized protein YciI
MQTQIITFFILASLLISCQSKKTVFETDKTEPKDTAFDSGLAEKLGADEYGMKAYVFAFLKSGPTRSKDPDESAKLMRAHLDNITRLAEEEKLVLAGPFMDDGEVRGIYIFDTNSIEKAKEWTNTDPAIKSGHLIMELKPWYGSAVLGLVNKYHKKVQSKDI